jgi:hypothetical protein
MPQDISDTARLQAAIANLSTPSPADLQQRMAAANARLLTPVQPASYDGPPVRIGTDAEWVTRPTVAGNWANDVLCITAVVACEDRRTRYIHYPPGPGRAQRPTLGAFLQGAFQQALAEGTIAAIPAEVVIFGHFLRGDVAAFEDFWGRRGEFRGLGRTIASAAAGHLVELDAVEVVA